MRKTVILVELNFEVSSLEVRESISALHETIRQQLTTTIEGGAFVLSTCHRYAILTFGESATAVIDVLRNQCPSLRKQDLLVLQGPDAIAHVFATTCGLHSRTVGEHEILGQMRQAFRSPGQMSAELHEWVKRAIRTGKRARTETYIGRYSTSLSAVTKDLISQHYDHTGGLRVLILGTGEMSRLVLHQLKSMGMGQIGVVSAELSRAKTLCDRPEMIAMTYAEAMYSWKNFDVIIGATKTYDYLLTSEPGSTPGAKRLLIDLGMPRNFDPALGTSAGVSLFDLDNINEAVSDSLRKRHDHVDSVHAIIDDERREFEGWLAFRKQVPKIQKIKVLLENVKDNFLKSSNNEFYFSEETRNELTTEAQHIIQQHFSQIIAVMRAGLAEKLQQNYQRQILDSLYRSLDNLLVSTRQTTADQVY